MFVGFDYCLGFGFDVCVFLVLIAIWVLDCFDCWVIYGLLYCCFVLVVGCFVL